MLYIKITYLKFYNNHFLKITNRRPLDNNFRKIHKSVVIKLSFNVLYIFSFLRVVVHVLVTNSLQTT